MHAPRRRWPLLATALLLFASLLPAAPAYASTFIVTTTTDADQAAGFTG